MSDILDIDSPEFCEKLMKFFKWNWDNAQIKYSLELPRFYELSFIYFSTWEKLFARQLIEQNIFKTINYDQTTVYELNIDIPRIKDIYMMCRL